MISQYIVIQESKRQATIRKHMTMNRQGSVFKGGNGPRHNWDSSSFESELFSGDSSPASIKNDDSDDYNIEQWKKQKESANSFHNHQKTPQKSSFVKSVSKIHDHKNLQDGLKIRTMTMNHIDDDGDRESQSDQYTERKLTKRRHRSTKKGKSHIGNEVLQSARLNVPSGLSPAPRLRESSPQNSNKQIVPKSKFSFGTSGPSHQKKSPINQENTPQFSQFQRKILRTRIPTFVESDRSSNDNRRSHRSSNQNSNRSHLNAGPGDPIMTQSPQILMSKVQQKLASRQSTINCDSPSFVEGTGTKLLLFPASNSYEEDSFANHLGIGATVHNNSGAGQESPSPGGKRRQQNSIQVSKLVMSVEMNPKDLLEGEQGEGKHVTFLVGKNDSVDKSQENGGKLPMRFKIGNTSFTANDIAYLNKVYKDGKTKVETSSVVEHREILFCEKVTNKICCRKEIVQGEEEEDDDWSVIVTPPYSSGESDDDKREHFLSLTEDAKKNRLMQLWRKTKAKALGGGRIVRRFSELSDNIAMFGASRRIAVEIEEEMEPLPFILMPDSKVRMGWNLVTMILLLYTASFVPYRTSFVEIAPSGLTTWEWIVDALFVIDIFINFISAYENNDKNIEARLKMIAKQYAFSWFLLDAAAVFPFQLLENSSSAAADADLAIISSTTQTVDDNGVPQVIVQPVYKSSSNQNINKLIRLARLPRLYRLLRILRLFKILSLLNNNPSFKKLQDTINMNAGIQRMIMIAFSVIFMVHLVACLYFLVGKFEDENEDNWIVFSGIGDEIDSYQYLVCVYWALQTLTTVGYGDIPARSVYEKIAALIWMIIGVGFYSFTIGNLASIFNSIDVKAANLQQKLAVLSEFSKRTHLPEEVQNRVIRFLENNHGDHLSLYDQKQLLTEVPASLRAEVVSHTHAEIIRRIKFFSDKDPPFLFAVLPLLQPMKVYPKDTLYCQGDYAEEVFFIYQGRIKMYCDLNDHNEGKADNVPFNLYVEGSYFGDSDIFGHDGPTTRDCTAISVVESQMLVITRKELFELFKRFREIKIEMQDVGLERKKHHQRSIQDAITRHKAKLDQPPQVEEYVQQVSDKSILDNIKQSFISKPEIKETIDNQLEHEIERARNLKLRQKQKIINNNQKDEVLNLLMNFRGPIGNNQHQLMNMNVTPKQQNEKQFHFELPSSSKNMSPMMRNRNESEKKPISPYSNNNTLARGIGPDWNGQRPPNISQFKTDAPTLPKAEDEELYETSSNESAKAKRSKLLEQNKKTKAQLFMENRNLDLVIQENDEEEDESPNDDNNRFHFRHHQNQSTSVDLAGRPVLIVEDDLDENEEDLDTFGWDQSEEIFSGFQENMALIAGNSFEILKLYEMIRNDYAKVSQRVQKAEQHSQQIQQRSTNLEDKLSSLLNIIV